MQESLDLSISAIDDIVERLEHEYEHKPIRLMGLKATQELMTSIYTAIVSLGVAVLQQLIPQHS